MEQPSSNLCLCFIIYLCVDFLQKSCLFNANFFTPSFSVSSSSYLLTGHFSGGAFTSSVFCSLLLLHYFLHVLRSFAPYPSLYLCDSVFPRVPLPMSDSLALYFNLSLRLLATVFCLNVQICPCPPLPPSPPPMCLTVSVRPLCWVFLSVPPLLSSL